MRRPASLSCRSLLLAPLAAALLVAGCATPTPYQPLGVRGTGASGGFSEQRLEDNRYRVSFRGNSYTSRERVENYLLFRAAEITVQSGYEGFTMVDRAVDPNIRTRVYSDPFYRRWGPYGGFGGWWGPSWRFHRRGFGWGYWDPWYGSPFWGNDIDVQTITNYEAIAEIVMFRGARPNDPRSFDARQVMSYLGPRIVLPR
jgi:hypothetical protein